MVYTTLAGLASYRGRAAGASAAIATARTSIRDVELEGQRKDLSILNAYEAYSQRLLGTGLFRYVH